MDTELCRDLACNGVRLMPEILPYLSLIYAGANALVLAVIELS